MKVKKIKKSKLIRLSSKDLLTQLEKSRPAFQEAMQRDVSILKDKILAEQKNKLIIAFDIVNDKRESVLPVDYQNTASSAIDFSATNLLNLAQVRAQIMLLVRDLAQSETQDGAAYYDADGAMLPDIDEKAYIAYLQFRAVALGRCEILEKDNNQGDLPPAPKSVAQLRDNYGAWWQPDRKNCDSPDCENS